MKIKPTIIGTHEEFATVIMVGYAHPQKFIPSKFKPTKYCDHENLYVYGVSGWEKSSNVMLPNT